MQLLFSFFLFLSSYNPCQLLKDPPSVLYFLFKGQIQSKLPPKRTSKMADTGKREDPSSIPGDGIPFFSFFFFFHPPPLCTMLEESSSVFCFTVRGQIIPKRYQRDPSKMAGKHESETARLNSLELKNPRLTL